MALLTTRSTLMHAALAHVSPELREFDFLAFEKLRRRTPLRSLSLSSMPAETLLLIRSHLLPVLITHFIATSAISLQHYEASLRHLICPQCTSYNEYVYGLDVWKWHLSGPCSCSPHTSQPRRPNPKQFRDRHHWLETYLSRKSLRFRGLSPQSSHSSPAIWEVVVEVLGVFGCEAIGRKRSRRGAGTPLLSRWDRQSILVVPLHTTHTSHDSLDADAHCRWTTRVLFGRLERDLGLLCDYNEPHHRLPSLTPPQNFCAAFELQASTQLPCLNAATFLLRVLETIVAPLSAFLSFVTLLLTVLCYYSRPGALRVF
ncbi:hypothetical protein DFH07DRAFT_184317 [Mycena maculata]|uniref:Uncharacterized protein n=1 Tax=Mycena maculata TaxID=230809 RepID=A0AAD7HVN2_9AGAR|nr:hypothetical protein DFH07DRAFT_184317 [Mycena maculata]